MLPDSFTAQDSDGNTYTILVINGHQDRSTLDSKSREIKLRKPELRTSDGRPVNYIRKGRYEILIDNKTRIIVESTDPNAI